MTIKPIFLALLVAVLVAVTRPAAADALLNAVTPRIDMSGKMGVLRDPTGRMTIGDVLHADFAPLAGNLSAGYSRDVFWLRLPLTWDDQAPSRWLVEVEMPVLDHVDFYVPDDRVGFIVTREGDRVAFADRPIAYRNFMFRVNRPRYGTHLEAYLRIETTSTISVKVHLWQPNAFVEASASEAIFLGILHGSVLILFIFGLALYAITRQRIYAFYTAYIAAAELLYINIDGYAAQFMFPDSTYLADRMTGLTVTLTVGLGYFFSKHLIVECGHHPIAAPFYRYCGYLSLALSSLVFFDKYYYAAPIMQVLVIALCCMQIALTLHDALAGNRPAAIYLAAFAIQLTSVTLVAFHNLGVPISVGLLDWGGQVGTVLQVVLLSVGLATRLTQLEQAKHRAELATADAAQSRILLRDQRNFLAMVGHEFRTPLSIIGGAADLLEISDPADERRRKGELSKVRRAVGRMVGLMDTCLADERLDSTFQAMSLIQLDPGLLLDRLCADWRSLTGRTIVLRRPPVVPPILGDAGLLSIALGNLIDNGVKYSPPGSEVRVDLEIQANGLRIRVGDDGPGIAAGDEARIFEKFYRSPATQQRAGVGLGLHMVKRIIDHHGGMVSVEHCPRQGACLVVFLPLA